MTLGEGRGSDAESPMDSRGLHGALEELSCLSQSCIENEVHHK